MRKETRMKPPSDRGPGIKTRRVALALGIALGLSGCWTENRTLESVHQPVVQRTDYMLDVAATDDLPDASAKQIVDWLNGLEPAYSDTISLDSGMAEPAPLVLQHISALVGRYGLTLSASASVSKGTPGAGQIRIILSRRSAEVVGCPDWRRPSFATAAGQTLSNYGCATNGNIAAMVADPADLVAGRKDKSADPNLASAKAIKDYGDGSKSAPAISVSVNPK